MNLASPDPGFIIDMNTLDNLLKLSNDARQKVLIVLHQVRILNAREQQMMQQAHQQVQAHQQQQQAQQQQLAAQQPPSLEQSAMPPHSAGQATTPSHVTPSPSHMTTTPQRPPTVQPQMQPQQNLLPHANRATPRIPPARPPPVQGGPAAGAPGMGGAMVKVDGMMGGGGHPGQQPGPGASMMQNPAMIAYLQNVQKPSPEMMRECTEQVTRFREMCAHTRSACSLLFLVFVFVL